MGTKRREEDVAGLIGALGACHEAIEWAYGYRSYRDAWQACHRGDWLLWLAKELDIDRRLVARAACACARTALKYVPDGEERPWRAIETAEAWARGEATINEVRAAAYAADAAAAYSAYYAAAYAAAAAYSAAAAAYSAAYSAADSAARAAYYAADAADAAAYASAHAAARAADAGAADAARRESLRRSADLVRKAIPWAVVKRALKESDQ